MAVTNYYSIAGEVIAERTAGSARVDYLTDGLGSITATVNQSAQVVNTYRYKPAGSQLAKTGIGADPTFGWAGYLPTQKRFSEHYLRGRHVSDLIGVFTTKDQFIAAVSPYAYALNNPVLFTDPMGWAPCQAPKSGQPAQPTGPAAPVTPAPTRDCSKNDGTLEYCEECVDQKCRGNYLWQQCGDGGPYDCTCCNPKLKGAKYTLCKGYGPGIERDRDCKDGVKGGFRPPPLTPAPPKAGSPLAGASGGCSLPQVFACIKKNPFYFTLCLPFSGFSLIACCNLLCPVAPTQPKPPTPTPAVA